MAKTIFLSERVEDLDNMAAHVGFDLTQSNPAEIALAEEGVAPHSFYVNSALMNELGTAECPVTPAQLMDNPTEQELNSYKNWINDCMDSLQTWLNGLSSYYIWQQKGDCWSCCNHASKIITQCNNADQVYALTDSGIEWLIYQYSIKLLAQDPQDNDVSDMEFVQNYIIDNYTGVCASDVLIAHDMDNELSLFQGDINGLANVTQITRDDIGGNNITTCSEYNNLYNMYNS